MKKLVLLFVVCTLLFVVQTVQADNLLAEIEDVVVRQVETSALFGNTGAALGLYWPIATIEKLNVTIGPMGAFGHEALLAGIGAQLPVSITVIGIELPVDFLYGALAWRYNAGGVGGAIGVGKVYEVGF